MGYRWTRRLRPSPSSILSSNGRILDLLLACQSTQLREREDEGELVIIDLEGLVS